MGLRGLPLKYRLPLIHGALSGLARWRAHGWTKAQDSTPVAGDFVVSGFLNEGFGIGRAGQLTADAIQAAGYDIIRHDLRPCFRRFLHQDAVLPGKDGVWLIHANAPEVLVALLAHAPAQWRDRYRIGFWAWETPKAPASWLLATDYLHEIWVPSRFVHDAMAAMLHDAGRGELIARLRIMPHPLPHPPRRHAHDRARFRLQDGVCEVLCLFDTKSSAVRKNPWGVIDAWTAAFPDPAPAARLTLKVSDLGGDPATAQRLHRLIAARPDIRLVTEHFRDRDMAAFISAFDILISLHRSEGFGLTLAEAMAAGVAVIATGWSGNTDFMTADNAWPVASARIPVHDPGGPYAGLDRDPDQVWAEPEIDAAARALSELTASPALRAGLGAAAMKSIQSLDAPWRRDALAALPFNQYL